MHIFVLALECWDSAENGMAYSVQCMYVHAPCMRKNYTCFIKPGYTVLARYGTPRTANLWAKATGQAWIRVFKKVTRKYWTVWTKTTGQVWIRAFKEEMRKCWTAPTEDCSRLGEREVISIWASNTKTKDYRPGVNQNVKATGFKCWTAPRTLATEIAD